MLLARRIHPEKRASIPNLPALLERIGEHFQHDVLIAKIIKRLDPKHRVRSSTVTRNAMAILTVMELMRSNPGMAKTEAINQAAAELYMTPDNVRKIPEIKNLKLR